MLGRLIDIDDTKKIGFGMILFGIMFMFLGVLLFFDAAAIAMGNVLFLGGLVVLIGVAKSIQFFSNPSKFKGTVAFFAGFLLVLWKWPIIGMALEIFGFAKLFGGFMPIVYRSMKSMPLLGTILSLSGAGRFIEGILSRGSLPA